MCCEGALVWRNPFGYFYSTAESLTLVHNGWWQWFEQVPNEPESTRTSIILRKWSHSVRHLQRERVFGKWRHLVFRMNLCTCQGRMLDDIAADLQVWTLAIRDIHEAGYSVSQNRDFHPSAYCAWLQKKRNSALAYVNCAGEGFGQLPKLRSLVCLQWVNRRYIVLCENQDRMKRSSVRGRERRRSGNGPSVFRNQSLD